MANCIEVIKKTGRSPFGTAATMSGIRAAILTVSDTRNLETDTSGDYLASSLQAVGHSVVHRRIVVDNMYDIRAAVSQWIADPDIELVLCTGGTGFSKRDRTPDALSPLFDLPIDGFGELFRHFSQFEIGTSTVQSRAVGGIANDTYIFALPGSTGACKTAWEKILREQFDHTCEPCNFAEIILRKRRN